MTSEAETLAEAWTQLAIHLLFTYERLVGEFVLGRRSDLPRLPGTHADYLAGLT